jgi:hypothetical protein
VTGQVEASQAARLGWMRLWFGEGFQDLDGIISDILPITCHSSYLIMPPLIGVVGVVVPPAVLQKYRLLVMLRNIPE